MYHSVSPAPGPYTVSPEAFFRQIKYIRENYPIVRLAEIGTLLLDRNDNKRRAVITFDDAYVNFLEFAYPVLKRFTVPCTIFVPTRYVGGSNEWDLKPNIDIAKRVMGKTDLLELAKEGLVDFGSHTVDHLSMRNLTRSEMEGQAVGSKRELERTFQSTIETFAYPYGQLRDFSNLTTEVLTAPGYKMAVTTRWGTLNSHKHRMKLKCISFEEADECDDLRGKIEGQYDWFAAKERIGHSLFILSGAIRSSERRRRETHYR
jgi:peptidoglycan/xylan/chitin deacetylase (PgdA/CDA1 family)